MLLLTETAQNSLKRLIAKRAENSGSPSEPVVIGQSVATKPFGLRLAVRRGGCAGMQYSLNIENSQPGDLIQSGDGWQLFVDPQSEPFLRGCTLDYRYALHDAGFVVINPQAARSCGCGTSFEPAASAPPAAALPETDQPCSSQEVTPGRAGTPEDLSSAPPAP